MQHQNNRSLCVAALKNDILRCKYLLNTGSNTNVIHEGDGSSPLICASQNGNLIIVQLLFKNGVNVNGKRNDGATALICASQNGHLDIVQLLLHNDANVNIQLDDGTTALICASQNGHHKIVKLLLKNNADDALKCKDGATALICAETKNFSKIVQLLLDHDAEARAKGGDTCELDGCFDGHVPSLETIQPHYIAQVTTESYDLSDY